MRSGLLDLFGRQFPKELTFTLPGKIVQVDDRSTAPLHTITKSVVGDNRLTVKIEGRKLSKTEESEIAAKLQAKYCGTRGPNCELKPEDLPDEARYATLDLVIKARREKYDLQTVVTVISLLFGSGIAFQLGKVALSRAWGKKQKRRRSTSRRDRT